MQQRYANEPDDCRLLLDAQLSHRKTDPTGGLSSAVFPFYEHKAGYEATALPSRQTVNKDYQSSRVVLGEFFSECRHFTFNSVQDHRLDAFVGLCHLVEIWPFVSSCINAVTMRTIKGEQLCSCRDLRIFDRGALRGRFGGGYGSVGLNDARRSQERADHCSGNQQSGDQSLYFDIHYEDTG